MKRNLVKSLVLRLMAFGLGCVAALLLLEVALRVYNPVESRVRGDRIVLPANRTYTFDGSGVRGLDATIVHTKNSIGFRGPEPPPEGLAEALSLVMVGGSTTECFYLSDGSDWPALVAERLAADFREVWWNNAGLDGHSTYGHEILLRDFLLDLKPRIFVFLVGVNDVGPRRPDAEHTASHVRGALRWDTIEGLIKSASTRSEVAALVLNLYRFWRARTAGLPHREIDLASLPQVRRRSWNVTRFLQSHTDAHVPAFAERLRNLVRTAKRAGIDPVLMTQPALYGEGIDPVSGVDLATVQVGSLDGRTMGSLLRLYNLATSDVAREENVLLIDLAGEMEKSSEYFYDFLHYTKAGAKEVAEIVYPHLRSYLLVRYRSFAIEKEVFADGFESGDVTSWSPSPGEPP